MKQYPFLTSKYGVMNKLPVQSIPDGAASDSLNWLTLQGKIELVRGYTPLGVENPEAGRVTGIKTGIRADGVNVVFKTYGKKAAYYSETLGDWVEIGTNLLGSSVVNSAGVAEDISFDFFEPVAGKQIWLNSPHAGPYKIMVSNPGDAISMYDSSLNNKSYMRIYDNRALVFNIDALDRTSVRMSYIEVRAKADYLQVTGESVANGAALAQKASTPKASFFEISGTGGAETFTDDGSGNLVGSAGGTGTINYATGVISFTPIAGAVVNLTAVSYRYVDETATWTPSGGNLSGSLMNFVFTLPRKAGWPNVFQQAHGGDIKAIASVGNHKFVGHQHAIWDLLPSQDDVTGTNTIFRENIGVPTLRGMFSTPEGIYTVDLNDPNNPNFILVTYSERTTDIKPINLSKNLDLSNYSFSELCVFPFNDYMCFAVTTSDEPHNNRVFLYHRIYRTWDILDYPISCADIYNNTLVGGDSLSNNVYTFFSGSDFDGDTSNNFWRTGISKLGFITPRGKPRIITALKKVKKVFLEGDIGPNQNIYLYASLDRGAFVEIGGYDETVPAVTEVDLADSYSETNQSATFTNMRSDSTTQAGQAFLAGVTGTTSKATFYLKKLGLPTGTMTAKLYAMSGVYGTSGVPTGSALATSTAVNVSSLTTSFALIDFTFANDYQLTSGVNYCIVVDCTSVTGDASNYVIMGIDNTAPTHGGNRFIQTGGTYSANSGQDACFYVYATVTTAASYIKHHPIIEGSGSYVDKSQQVTIGSVTLGNKNIGDGSEISNNIEAYHYERYLDFGQSKFSEIQFKISAGALGYASVTKFDLRDIRILQDKPNRKYRVE